VKQQSLPQITVAVLSLLGLSCILLAIVSQKHKVEVNVNNFRRFFFRCRHATEDEFFLAQHGGGRPELHSAKDRSSTSLDCRLQHSPKRTSIRRLKQGQKCNTWAFALHLGCLFLSRFRSHNHCRFNNFFLRRVFQLRSSGKNYQPQDLREHIETVTSLKLPSSDNCKFELSSGGPPGPTTF
jgi:hypothetical protein